MKLKMRACSSEEPSRCCGSDAMPSKKYEEVMVSNTRENKARNVRTPSFLRTYCCRNQKRSSLVGMECSNNASAKQCNAVTPTTLL